MTRDAISAAHGHRTKSLRIVAGVILAAVLLAVLAGWVARVQILRAVARVWVVSDSIAPADAIAVLGGGLETRPFAAADLYKEGIVGQILVSAVKPSPAEKLNIVPSHVELNRAVLLKLGVPPEAIVSFGNGVSNTYEEARALSQWAKTNGIKSIIVPTEIFSSRRVRWILDKQLGTVGVRIQVQALPPLEYDIDNWWQHEAGVIAFQNEVIKYLYYIVKY
jgi:uncharacterized SAM-binding protein YcdF (DUF218 family)